MENLLYKLNIFVCEFPEIRIVIKMKFVLIFTFTTLVFLETCNRVCSYAAFGNKTIRGVNLGGWLVLEKWIRPSVFANLPSTVVDEYTFCQNLGKTEAEKRIRAN